MAEENVLQSFLVALGVKVDEVQFRKGLETVEKFGKEILKLGAIAETVSIAVVGGLGKMARSFEDAYYSASRTGSSIKELKAFGYAVSQMGGNADEAVASLEALAIKIKTNPGYKQLVKTAGRMGGVDIDTEHGTAKMVEDLGKAYAGMSESRRRLFSSEIGQSETTLNAIADYKQLNKLLGEYNAKAAVMGVDLAQAGKDGKDLSNSFRSLGATFDLIGQSIGSKLFKELGPALEQLTAYLDQHGKEIADIVVEIAGAFLKLFTAVVEHLPDIDAFVKKIGGWDVVLALIGTALLTKFVPGLTALAGAMTALAGITAPAWLLGMLGLAAPGIESAAKGVFDQGFNAVTGGPPTDDTKALQSEGAWGLTKRLWRDTKRLFGGGGKGVPAGAMPTGSSAGNLSKLIEEESKRAGIDPRILEGIRAGESAHKNTYDVGDVNDGGAYGPFQFNMGKGRFGAQFKKDTGLDPTDPKTIPAQTRYMAEFIAKQLKKDPNYASGRRGSRLHGVWHGYEGPKDANPRWGEAGYVPEAPKPSSPRAKPIFLPGAMPKINNPLVINPYSFASPPLGNIGPQTSNDNRIHMPTTTNITVSGVSDPNAAAGQVASNMGRQHSTLLRNLQSAIG